MYLQIAACTSGVTCLYVVALVVDGVQLGNLWGIPSEVTADVPFPIFGLDGNQVHTDFKTFAFHITDVGFDTVGKVTAGRYKNVVQQVFRVTPVVVNRTRDAVVQETVVDTDVVSFRSLPFNVGIVAVGAVGGVPLVTEQVSGLIVRCSIGGQMLVVGTDGLLAGLTVAQTEF